MRILILTEYFPSGIGKTFTGGVEARVYHLANYLKLRGHQITIKSRTDKYSFNTLSALIERFKYLVREGSDLLRRSDLLGKYDIVEGTNFSTHILAFLYAKRVGAKAVAWYPDVFIGHGVERLGLISGIVTELAERLAIRLSWDGVISLSGETKKKLIKAGLKAKKIETIYGGVDIDKYKKVQEGTCLAGRQARKYKNATIICVVRLVKYKRVQDLLLAIYFLRERFKDIRVIIVGDGPEFAKLKVKSEKLKVADKVRFLDSVSEEEKWELLIRSHIHALPSVVEGFGLVSIESLSVGTPVVNADIPINREILQKEEGKSLPAGKVGKKEEGNTEDSLVQGGLLFRAGDAADLAEKIEILLLDKKLYNQKAGEGRELAKRYEWEKINKQTEEFYQRLLSD